MREKSMAKLNRSILSVCISRTIAASSRCSACKMYSFGKLMLIMLNVSPAFSLKPFSTLGIITPNVESSFSNATHTSFCFVSCCAATNWLVFELRHER